MRTVDLAITGDCHYKCVFCSAYRMYKKGGIFLTVEQIRRIWEQCVALGAIHINLTGGEPFLRDLDEVCQIIKNLNPRHFLVSLVSNGLNITKEKLSKLKLAGLDTLQLSIESIDPQRHDEMVGIKGSFDKVIDAIGYAKELKLIVCLNVVFYSSNEEEIKKLIDWTRKERVFLVLNTASVEGKWRDAKDKKLKERDAELFKVYARIPNVRHDSSVNFSGRMECPGGKERIHINAYGDVLTCPLVQISYGNVLKESLDIIYKRMLKMPHLREYSLMCKQAFDEKYYNEVMLPLMSWENRPMPIFNHPLYRRIENE